MGGGEKFWSLRAAKGEGEKIIVPQIFLNILGWEDSRAQYETLTGLYFSGTDHTSISPVSRKAGQSIFLESFSGT